MSQFGPRWPDVVGQRILTIFSYLLRVFSYFAYCHSLFRLCRLGWNILTLIIKRSILILEMARRQRRNQVADVAALQRQLDNLTINNRTQPVARRKRRNRARRGRNNGMFDTNAMMVTAPVSGGGIVSRNLPPQINTSGQVTIVRNCELIYLVGAAAGRIPLAPFQTTWLEGVASSYSKWRWNKLRLIYIPSCGTSTTGNIVFGLGYDFQDSAPPSLLAASQSFHSVTTVPWAGFEGSHLLNDDTFAKPGPGSVCVDFDVNRQALMWYTHCTAATFPATAADKNQYCPAYLDVTLSGPAVTGFGQLFIKYEAALIEPIAFIDNQ